jgi:integrase
VDDIRSLCVADRKRILDSTYGLDRIMLILMFETGLPVEDLIKLRVSDIDLVDGFIHPSGGERFALSPQSQDELKGYLNSRPNQSFLFEGRCGKPITAKWKRCVLDKLLQARLKG